MSVVRALGKIELDTWLEKNPAWKHEGGAISADFKFADFTEAFAFLAVVARLSDEQDHHAKIENLYNRVKLTLTTHDAGNQVSQRDIFFAERISEWKGL